ncbi:hypothetical protein V8G54_003608 [Vigna mungo]|uniref:PGG domain-containing protein n=1 Tax=Vigna mungo TaxID=3915 RepID=A0AAQ3PCW8_VIGMU
MAIELLKNEHVKLAVKHADKEGRNPLHYAVKKRNKVLTELLLEQNMSIAYMEDNEGMTALHIAAADGIIRITRNLSMVHVFNEKDVDGNTPLHLPNCFMLFVPIISNLRRSFKAKFAYSRTEDSNAMLMTQIVVTLIATVSFAAGITLPGGTIQDGEHKANWKEQYELALNFTLFAFLAMIVAFASATYAVLGSSLLGIAVITLALLYFCLIPLIKNVSDDLCSSRSKVWFLLVCAE